MHHETFEPESNQASLTPIACIVFHADGYSCRTLTYHPVGKDGQIEIGSYVRASSVQSMLSQAASITQPDKTELLPSNVLLDNAKSLVWYVPSAKRTFHFKNQQSFHANLNHPALLFVRKKTEQRLSIFALESDERPTANTTVYHAPFFNINGAGSLCIGDAYLPSEATYTRIPEMESAIFDANGSHVNHSQTLATPDKVSTADLLGFWRKKAKSGEVISTAELRPYKTLAEVIA